MFEILSLFCEQPSYLARVSDPSLYIVASRDKREGEDPTEGQRLVRLPLDELQQQSSEQS
jgi:hypothetical protein